QHLGNVLGHDERSDHRDGRGQAHLKAGLARQRVALAGPQEILIRGARFARIAELSETNVPRLRARPETQRKEADPSAEPPLFVRLEERSRAQQRPLPAYPQPPAAHFSIRTTLDVRLHGRADRLEHLLGGIEADAADEVHVYGHGALTRIRLSVAPRRTGCAACRDP